MHRLSIAVLYPLIDLILYSNAWVAACAVVMCWQTQLLLSGHFHLHPLGAFIFFSTLLLYALHRLVGLKKVEGLKNKGRFLVIERFKLHIGLYAVLAGLASLWFARQLPVEVWWWIWPGILVSAAYVLPVFGQGRRLRDFHYIKIFFIALSWAWITVVVPAVEFHLVYNIPMALLFFERMFFIFAIALPFDIRDLEIDRSNAIKTVPSVLGVRRTKMLALLALVWSGISGGLAFRLDAYSPEAYAGLVISLLSTAVVILFARPDRHDYFFSGLVDGMILWQFACVWFGAALG